MVEWKVLGESVRGASHIRNDLPNQDAIKICEHPLILAVADGHGSTKCPHSDLGAQFAVNTAIETIKQALTSGVSFLSSEDNLKELVPKNIHKLWKSKVDEHLEKNPVSETKNKECAEIDLSTEVENNKSYENNSPTDTPQTNKNVYLPFGATLLILCITEKFAFFWQIGDGDIVIIQSDGILAKPIPIDDRLLGNETTSLCRTKAWQDFRSYFMPIINPPKAIFLVTDGYKNSFKEPEGFDKALEDIYSFIQMDGEDSVKANLADWLNEASQSGSGDDITLVVAYSVDSPNISMECISEDI
jgi:serine/threonine protein phosphatase PrpC